MTYFFEVDVEAFIAPSVMPANVSGVAIVKKRAVLYGSEGGVKVFSSEFSLNENDFQNSSFRNLPRAAVQVADPVALSAKLCSISECNILPQIRIPDMICRRFGGEFVRANSSNKALAVTLGIFTIVQIERNVQMVVPAYDFCVPNKKCSASTDDPCTLFSRIEFPTEEFFPPRMNSQSNENSSGNLKCCNSSDDKKE